MQLEIWWYQGLTMCIIKMSHYKNEESRHSYAYFLFIFTAVRRDSWRLDIRSEDIDLEDEEKAGKGSFWFIKHPSGFSQFDESLSLHRFNCQRSA